MQPLTKEQARKLIEVVNATGDRQRALWMLALATGMRQGEILALTWRAVDLPAKLVHVRRTLKRRAEADGGYAVKEPKTKRSRRSVRIPPDVVAALKEHRTRQAQERLAMGPAWHTDLDLVFCRQDGYYLANNTNRAQFHSLLKRAGLPQVRVHDLRHTFATLALAAGINVKVVSEILGHANIGITLEVYGHVMPDMQEHAVAAISDVLFAPEPSPDEDRLPSVRH